jgi:hypothetical protein
MFDNDRERTLPEFYDGGIQITVIFCIYFQEILRYAATGLVFYQNLAQKIQKETIHIEDNLNLILNLLPFY